MQYGLTRLVSYLMKTALELISTANRISPDRQILQSSVDERVDTAIRLIYTQLLSIKYADSKS